jgi:hypothetical protein
MDLSACSENELLELFRLILSMPGEITKSQRAELYQINDEAKRRESYFGRSPESDLPTRSLRQF